MDEKRKDCYFYWEDFDMGAIIPHCNYEAPKVIEAKLDWCDLPIHVYEERQCQGCDKYISKSDVYRMVKEK